MATESAKQIDDFLNHVRMLAENQREILICDRSDANVTTTQGHVLMLLAQQGPQTNTALAQALQVSPAAITKAMKVLQNDDEPMVAQIPDENDLRVTRWSLTQRGITLASAHAQEHRDTLAEYDAVLADFNEEQQAVIGEFLTAMTSRLDGGQMHGK
ncbi:MarR family transcriptional regulator [Weissella ceti]|uniref:MarR family transcriptional regulator n=1 Tax=Weissella ceti TaxID=759620 RepID=A0ABT3E4R2_9LACO|nr:MarR family transcriptional regulator [Weissella ceti]MCW0953418.1 MarR family transcriptional regulator [Weissella ceti]QVK12021.1 MarR family transcriptional regulator [Weissella ceti]